MKFKKLLCAAMAAAVLGTACAVPTESGLSGFISVSASAAEKLAAPQGLKATVNGKKVTLEWKAVKGADGYEIFKYDTAEKKYVKLKAVKDTRTTVSGLSEGKHSFKVAASAKSGKTYVTGKLSEKVSVKIEEKQLTSVQLAKAMGKGWNLGNTMEATGDWVNGKTVWDYEKCWGAPKTNADMMKGIKEAGFDTVRVPVAWSNLMVVDGKYTINPELFDRIDEIVGYVLDNDMYCILNIHWDGGWWDGLYSKNEAVSTETMKKYKALWTQIANHYADYSNKLIFESANEELGKDPNNKLPKNSTFAIVNEANQNFVDIVRASGGNNPKRYLLIAGYNTNIDDTINSKFEMPKDTIKDHLLISVHYYNPSTYCIADLTTNSWGYLDSWGTKADIDAMEKELAKMAKFTEAGYGVVIGEYGVAHRKEGNKYYVKDGTADFYKNVVKFCKKYGFCPVLWDTPGNWYDRVNLKFFNDEIAEVFKRN